MYFNTIDLTEECLRAADDWLKGLVKRLPIHGILLIEESGYPLLYAGKFHFLPPQEMSVLIMATYGAMQALSSMTAANQVTVKFHGSPLGSLMVSPVTSQFVLAMMFNEVEEKEELIRDRMKEVSKNLRDLIKSGESTFDGENSIAPVIPLSSRMFIDEKLDEIFSDIFPD